MTENVTGYLSSLAYGAATGASLPAFASDSYTSVPDLESVTPAAGSRQVDEYYVLDTKAAKKVVGSLTYDVIQFNGTRAFDSAAQDQVEDDANASSSVRRNFRVTLPNAGAQIQYCAGYVSKFQYGELTNQGRITFSGEITVDGAITIVR
jgi:hypothetical protein